MAQRKQPSINSRILCESQQLDPRSAELDKKISEIKVITSKANALKQSIKGPLTRMLLQQAESFRRSFRDDISSAKLKENSFRDSDLLPTFQ